MVNTSWVATTRSSLSTSRRMFISERTKLTTSNRIISPRPMVVAGGSNWRKGTRIKETLSRVSSLFLLPLRRRILLLFPPPLRGGFFSFSPPPLRGREMRAWERGNCLMPFEHPLDGVLG